MRNFILGIIAGLFLTAAVSFAQSDYYRDMQRQQLLLEKQRQERQSEQIFQDMQQRRRDSQYPC